jgi:hypothetical protein
MKKDHYVLLEYTADYHRHPRDNPLGYFGGTYRSSELPAILAKLRACGVITVWLDEKETHVERVCGPGSGKRGMP